MAGVPADHTTPSTLAKAYLPFSSGAVFAPVPLVGAFGDFFFFGRS